MKDINKLLDSVDTYCVVMGENPVEYVGYGDAINFAKYLIEKFHIKDATILEKITRTYAYFDVVSKLEDRSAFDNVSLPTEVAGEDISNYELDILLTIDYLMSDSCSEAAYNTFMEAMAEASVDGDEDDDEQ